MVESSQEGAQDEDGFVSINTTRKRKNRKNRSNKYIVREKTVDDYLESLKTKRQALTESAFLTEFNKVLDDLAKNKTIKRIRCLALGSPTETLSNHASMYQLALLQLIAERLEIDAVDITSYDPCYTKEDEELFDKIGIKTIERYDRAQEQDYECLVYMLHAEKPLTEEILNVPSKFILIGNELEAFDVSRIGLDLEKDYPCIYDGIKQIKDNKWTSTPIPNSISAKQPYSEAFNGLTFTHKK